MNSKRRYSYSGNLTTAHWYRYSFNYTCIIKSPCFLSYWCDVTLQGQPARDKRPRLAIFSLQRAPWCVPPQVQAQRNNAGLLKMVSATCYSCRGSREIHKLYDFNVNSSARCVQLSPFPHLFELFSLPFFPPLEVHLKLIRCVIDFQVKIHAGCVPLSPFPIYLNFFFFFLFFLSRSTWNWYVLWFSGSK